MNLYETYLFGFSRTVSGSDVLGITPPDMRGSTGDSAVDPYFTALALGCYCAKNNVLLTRQQFNSIHPKLTQQT